MANITRTDPFQELTRFEPLRDFEGMFGWPRSMRRFLQELPAEPTMKIDVSENDKTYTVKAELPGVKKEDIKVDVEGSQVSVSAEVKREKEEKKGEAIVHSERYYGKQFRRFTLGHEIDRKNTKAKFENGVLEITLPKNGGTSTPPIAIE
ncbi:MAG: Hsp20/alpha crystallin family protein [Usitatibacter sp.]